LKIKPVFDIIDNMRGLEESTETIRRVSHDAKERVYRAWEGFVDFAARDNVLEVALGLM
jgi:large conductance mechanosensitive channel